MGGGKAFQSPTVGCTGPGACPPPTHTHTHGYTYTYTLCPCHLPAGALHAPTPTPPPPPSLPIPVPGQDIICVGRNFRGTTSTRKGTTDGPPVLQVGGLGVTHQCCGSLGLCQRACPTLSCAHCTPIRALPLTPPPPLQSILDYFEEHRRVVYLVRVVHVPLAAFWKPLGGWVPPPTCPMCALCSGCQPCVRSSVGCAGVTCGARCPAQRGRWVFVWHVLKHPLHPPPFPTTHTQHPGRMSSGRPSGATLVKTSSWMAPNTARSSASPVTRSSTAM